METGTRFRAEEVRADLVGRGGHRVVAGTGRHVQQGVEVGAASAWRGRAAALTLPLPHDWNF
jgi:hypothetical protein